MGILIPNSKKNTYRNWQSFSEQLAVCYGRCWGTFVSTLHPCYVLYRQF